MIMAAVATTSMIMMDYMNYTAIIAATTNHSSSYQ